MRNCWKIAGWLGAVALAAACGGEGPVAGEPLIGLFGDLGSHRRPISTRSEPAQRYFDQGLNLSYAFNVFHFKVEGFLKPVEYSHIIHY